MRDILKRDFAFIQALAPDPRLVNKNHTPQEFGECAGKDAAVAKQSSPLSLSLSLFVFRWM